IGKSCVRRDSVFERIKQETELAVGLFFRKAQGFKHFLLNIVLMDPDASAADLISIENDVIRLCTYFSKFSLFQKRKVLFHGHGEGMMHSQVTVLLVAPLKLRELRNPDETVLVLVKEFKLFCKLHTQR